MSERILITKLVRNGDRAELFGRGHKYKDLTLFCLSDLADVGVDYANLKEGEDTPCRFWAVYELSDKLNSAGNPYKDVIALEPISAPATTTSTDNSALLAELRAIRQLLVWVVDSLSDQPAAELEPEPEEEPQPTPQAPPAPDAPTILDNWFPRDTDEQIPTSPQALLAAIKARTGNGFPGVRELYDALCIEISDFRWPAVSDLDGWRETANTALLLATS